MFNRYYVFLKVLIMSGILSNNTGCSQAKDSYNADIIIANAWVVTMDESSRLIENGAVVICNDSILAVGRSDDILSKYNAPRIYKGTNRIVMPGLINTHTHSPMTIFRGFADDLHLHEWLYDHIFPIESEFITKENVRLGAKLAIAEMLMSGTTTFNDMYYYGDEIAHIAEKAGIRAVITEGLIDFAVPNSETPEHGLDYTERMIKKWAGHDIITIGVAAHAPYSSSAELIQSSKNLAEKHNVPFNIHVAETRKEFDQIKDEHGLTPVAYLDKLGVLCANVVMAHAIHLTSEDIELIAKRGAGVAHNPVCNMKLASGVAPVPEFIEAGVKLGLGTDGVASNNNLDMFSEMNTAALLHKINSNDPTVVDAKSVIEMATIGGAKVLGFDEKIGSIEVGKKADLILLELNKPHAYPLFNVYSQIVYSLKSSDVETVIINGKVVMDNREVVNIDEKALYNKVDSLTKEIIKHVETK